jgi:hypothetical protein
MGNLIARLLHYQPEHETNLPELPEGCISAILSFTTPRHVCRLSAVSKLFTSAANSDSLWNKFLTQQCLHQILSKAVSPIAFSSKRELYFCLCDPILIDGGTKMFWLERSTAKMGYMLSARELSIAFADEEYQHWRWVSLDDSRFNELAELKAVSWLEVRGRMDCGLLSANTEYRVVFVLKFGECSYGWKELPIKFSITTPDGKMSEVAIKFSVTTPYEEEFEMTRALVESRRRRVHRNVNDSSSESEDDDEEGHHCDADYCYYNGGWLEVVAGEFSVRGEEDYCYDDAAAASPHIEFCMEEVDSGRWKGGLLIDGVRIEPKFA